MYDKVKITSGLLAAIILFTFPLWFNIGKTSIPPAPELTTKAKDARFCVLSKKEMRIEHPSLLNEWRDKAIRKGERIYVSHFTGQHHDISLQNTCMNCHSNKSKFCDKCHTYTGVTGGTSPYCWECHLEPEES